MSDAHGDPPAPTAQLRRTLGLTDAVVVGVGSMVGAGVFTAWSPAAAAAGNGLLIGLAIAAVIAFCNATSSAQLAARHPESGGTYLYGRERLGPGWGHLAGWGFVVGKTASCAAMALTVGTYLWPAQARLTATVAVVAITAVNIGGLTRTVAVTKLLLIVCLTTLAAVIVAGVRSESASLDRLTPLDTDAWGVLRSAGFLFFAFAGYARIATLGEEVRDPETTIPRAIPTALALVLAIYALVAVVTLAVVPVEALAATDAPLRLVAELAQADGVATVVRIGAGVAALGVLLNLIPGISRTVLAMARRRELPATLAVVDRRWEIPLRAELTISAIIVVVVLTIELRNAIALSGVAVLAYYAITNAAALRLRRDERRWPAAIAWVGLVGCAILIAALPLRSVLVGSAVLATGVVARLVSRRGRPRST